MKKLQILIFVAAIVALLSGCEKDQEITLNNEITVSVDGYVINQETNTPLDGVTVTISDKAVRTNANGYFKVTSLSPGEYCFKFEKEGFLSHLECYLAAAPGQDYYGNSLQTSLTAELMPRDKSAILIFRYQEGGEYSEAPAGLNVTLSYENSNIITSFSDLTTQSDGSITIPNIAHTTVRVQINEIVDGYRYSLNKTISATNFRNAYNETLRILITKTEVTENEFDL